MSPAPALILICGFVLFGYAPARAQFRPFPADTPVLRKWSLSFNPLGMLEDPGAIGAGIGFHFNKGMEIWEETSFLHGLEVTFPNGGLTGFRQIIRIAGLPPRGFFPDPNYFVAVELRFKTYSYHDIGYFSDPAASDTVGNVHFFSRHYIFGAAVQGGYRLPLFRGSHWSGELTFGLGLKYKQISRHGAPSGYQYLKVRRQIDVNLRDDFIEVSGWSSYIPGSLRIIYTFGRKLN